jgi:uncharacterized membrane protein YfcA
MTTTELLILTILFFLTSVVGVVTGSNSLITVPVMFQFGIDEKIAVATNMFGLTFMAIGGTIPFVRQRRIDARGLIPVIIFTAIGSAIGAMLVGLITNSAIKLIVVVAMIVVTIFTVVQRRPEKIDIGSGSRFLVYALAFFLAVYGGLYSGGYVTILTAVLVAFSGMTFGESIAATKLINVFSSGIATIVFMWQGLVDYRLGIILGVAMFAGAYVGAHYATRMNEVWLRRIFLATVLVLAGKTLFDFL